jgi:hypothetical protein
MYLIRERSFRLGEGSDITRRARPASTYRHIRVAVPWVLAKAIPAEEADLRATAPHLLGVIQDRVWEPRFARLMAPLDQQS